MSKTYAIRPILLHLSNGWTDSVSKTLTKVINQRTKTIILKCKRERKDQIQKTAYFLGSCVPINTYNCGLWIGLNDQEEEGQFKWENSNLPVTFSNWLPGEPDGREHKNCVEMLQDGTWNDRYCWRNNPFVCEMAWHLFIIKIPPSKFF